MDNSYRLRLASERDVSDSRIANAFWHDYHFKR